MQVDDNKQIQLFVACNPNDGVLMMLYISKKMITSLKIPKIIESSKIITSLEIVKYNPSNPY